MIRDRVRYAVMVTAGLAACATLASLAGPIDPPSGPVGPTYKTLSEVEPRTAINEINTPGDALGLFKITQPGSYYLTDNITGVAGKHGIEIASRGVTIDLGGFTLLGVPGSLDGITSTSSDHRETAILNGTIRSWGGDGVDLRGIGGRVQNVMANFNGERGIFVNDFFTIRNCQAAGNGVDGFRLDAGTTVMECIAVANGRHGFDLVAGNIASDCVADGNTGSGFSALSDNVVTGCVSIENLSDGILAQDENVLRDNSCMRNGVNSNPIGAGIQIGGANNRLEGNTCDRNEIGIDVDGPDNFIVRNVCSGNSLANWTIVAGNTYGPIVVMPAGAAVSGDSAPGGVGSTDPNANFTN